MDNTKSRSPARIARTTLALTVCLGAAVCFVAACNGEDPIPQAIIDSLPPESGSPSATHRPGQPCLQCHSTYGEALPNLVIGGTIFKEDATAPNGIKGAAGLKVIVYDSTGDSRVACTNSAGNFYIERDNWEAITFPLKSFVGDDGMGNSTRRMQSIIGREGSCANCHKLPSADRPGTTPTGASHDSPGVIIVEDGEESPSLCPGVP
jgi:hypothetical protein